MNAVEMDYLSFGGGVQTTALLFLKREGIVNYKKAMPDYVYKHIEKMDKIFPNEIEIVKQGDIIDSTYKEKFITAPIFSRIDDKNRKGRRVCTFRFKILPVQNKIRQLTNTIRKRLKQHTYSLGLGFSTDEYWRAKENRTRWIKNIFPLLKLKMSRKDCIDLLKKYGITPVRSACYFCPLMSDGEWKNLKDKHPKEFEKAVIYDEKIRDITSHKNYLHRSHRPLKEIDFNKNKAQIDLFAINDCESGYCGT